MKLTYEDKIQIYELRKQGESFRQLSNQFGINISNLRYMIKLIDRYGIEIAKKGKNRYYSPELKEEIINNVLLKGRSLRSVSLDYVLPDPSLLKNWIAQYKENGYTIFEKTRGRAPENERLRTEVAYLKKLKELEDRDEALQRERQRQLEKWFQEDFD